MVSIIVARSSNHVIGHGGALPWRLPTDMRRFRELTTGTTVIMGRKTFESLPAAYRPLPNRRNLVLASDPHYRATGAESFDSLEAAVEACSSDCFIIGGERVYAEALPAAERLYITCLDGDYDGDAYFPELVHDDWTCVERSDRMAENGHEFRFEVYERAR